MSSRLNRSNRSNRSVRSTHGSQFEALEVRQLMAAAVRSIDGSGNNLAHSDWGKTFTQLLRLAPASYADGISAPTGAARPSARAVSNAVAAHPVDTTMENDRQLSAFAYLWGQFIDHDMDLTTTNSSDKFNVSVPTGDPYFDPNGTGTQVIGFTRSKVVAGTGVTNARQQANEITSWIDGSMVYGSDATRAAALRTFVGGKLKTSAGNLLPFNTAGLTNDTVGGPASAYFLAGDVRANENIELTSIQTLFVREHNRLAADIARSQPRFTDEQIYQQARKLVIAEIQAITYNEYLPALLGRNAIAPYSGYKPNVNPSISTEFSTAAFRLGHSMLEDDVDFLDNNGNDTRESLALAQAFFNPGVVSETGIDPIMKYLASTNSEEIDTTIVDGVRNFLFGQPGQGGFDLASLNIQRGRDHGLADYNTTREKLGLGRVTSFAQITSDVTLQQKLQSLYGSVNNVDLWVGGLAENHVSGSSLGPTFQRIVADQFTRLRDGDRFWYQASLSRAELQQVGQTRLSDVIKRNSTATNLQDNVFVFDVTIAGRVVDDRNGNGIDRGDPGLGNIKVNVTDADGEIVATATTQRDGTYRVVNLDLGSYTVRPVLPGGFAAVGAASQDRFATKGIAFDRVDFAARRQSAPPPPNVRSGIAQSAPGAGLFSGLLIGGDRDSQALI